MNSNDLDRELDLQQAADPVKSDIGLVVLDIDGTLTGGSNEVSPRVQEAILVAKQQGVQIGIATGRMYQSAKRFHQIIQATMPISAYQGALIRHPDDNVTHHHWLLDQIKAQQFIDYLADYPFIIHVYIEDHLYVRELTPLSQNYAERCQVPLSLLSDLNPAQWPANPTKVLAMASEPDVINQLVERIRQDFPPEELYLTRSIPTFLEATHPVVNKGNAVKYVAEDLLGLKPEQVLVIGDSDNDIEMIQYAGLGVAMGNARTEIQALADWVAPTVDDDGVAVTLERFVLS